MTATFRSSIAIRMVNGYISQDYFEVLARRKVVTHTIKYLDPCFPWTMDDTLLIDQSIVVDDRKFLIVSR